MLPAQLGSWVCSNRPSKHFVAAAQKALDRNLMNENVTLEGLKKSRPPETGLAQVSETVGRVPSHPGQRRECL